MVLKETSNYKILVGEASFFPPEYRRTSYHIINKFTGVIEHEELFMINAFSVIDQMQDSLSQYLAGERVTGFTATEAEVH